MGALTSFGEGIYAIDSGYVRPGLAAIYVLVQQGRVALIETGCNSAVSRVVKALNEIGIARVDVDFVIPTHVHLDHAGGAGAMMREFPNARPQGPK